MRFIPSLQGLCEASLVLSFIVVRDIENGGSRCLLFTATTYRYLCRKKKRKRKKIEKEKRREGEYQQQSSTDPQLCLGTQCYNKLWLCWLIITRSTKKATASRGNYCTVPFTHRHKHRLVFGAVDEQYTYLPTWYIFILFIQNCFLLFRSFPSGALLEAPSSKWHTLELNESPQIAHDGNDRCLYPSARYLALPKDFIFAWEYAGNRFISVQ